MLSTGIRLTLYRMGLRITSRAAPVIASRALEKRFLSPARHSVPAWESALAASATITWLSTRSGEAIPVYRWGEGPAILLVHGWSSRGTQLGRFIGPARDQGFSVITFDAPGHGCSAARLTGLPEMIDALEQVIAAHQSIAGVVAHSLGTVAASYVLGHLGTEIPSVYIAPPQEPGRYLAMVGDRMNVTPKAVSLAQRRIEQRFGTRFLELNHLELAQHVPGRVLVVHDHGDKEVAFEEGQRVAQALANSTLRSTTGLGHRRILKSEDVVKMAINHLLAKGQKPLSHR